MNSKVITVLFKMTCIGFLLLLLFSGSQGVTNRKKIFHMKYSVRDPLVFPDTDKIIFPSTNNDNDYEETGESPPAKRKELDPCEKFIPPKPRFSGARTSDLKCAEYLSQMINREMMSDREERCRIKQGQSTERTRITIISKHATKPAQFPHMAAVGWRRKNSNRWAFLCGGSLISPNFVLTAAHCSSIVNSNIMNSDPEIVRLGTRNIQRPKYEVPVDVKITKIIQHPYWDSPKRYYDIALIELETPVEFSRFVQPACLPGKFFTSTVNATVTGWGVTDVKLSMPSSTLQMGHVDIIDSKLCDELVYGHRDRLWWGLMDHQVCAGKIQGGVDTCQGDSGGPLQVQLKETLYQGSMHMVIGITSFGVQRDKCGEKGQPGIYTRVSSFVDWIESIVWPNRRPY